MHRDDGRRRFQRRFRYGGWICTEMMGGGDFGGDFAMVDGYAPR